MQKSLGYSCATTLAVWAAPRSAPQVLHVCFVTSAEATFKDSVMLWEGEVKTRNRHKLGHNHGIWRYSAPQAAIVFIISARVCCPNLACM